MLRSSELGGSASAGAVAAGPLEEVSSRCGSFRRAEKKGGRAFLVEGTVRAQAQNGSAERY